MASGGSSGGGAADKQQIELQERLIAYLCGNVWRAEPRLPGSSIYVFVGLEFDAKSASVAFIGGPKDKPMKPFQIGSFTVSVYPDYIRPPPPGSVNGIYPPGSELLYVRTGGIDRSGTASSQYAFDGDAKTQISPHRLTGYRALIELNMRAHPFCFYDFIAPALLADREYEDTPKDNTDQTPLAPFSPRVPVSTPASASASGGSGSGSGSGSTSPAPVASTAAIPNPPNAASSDGKTPAPYASSTDKSVEVETVEAFPARFQSVIVQRNGERRYLLSVHLLWYGIEVAGVQYQARPNNGKKSTCIIA